MSESYLVLCTIHPITERPVPHVGYLLSDTELSETLYGYFHAACQHLQSEGSECVIEVVPRLKTNPLDPEVLDECHEALKNAGFKKGLLPIILQSDFVQVADAIEKFYVDNDL